MKLAVLNFLCLLLNKIGLSKFGSKLKDFIFILKLKDQGYIVSEDQEKYYFLKNEITFQSRKKTSDLFVFDQIILSEEYKVIIDLAMSNFIEINSILDIGANVGFSSMYFSTHFPNSNIYALEPEESNFKALVENLNSANCGSILPIKGAIWNESAKLSINRNFRDGKEWSASVSKSEVGNIGLIDSFTIQQLLEKYQILEIDILKIDIEGAERYLFDENISNLDFLKHTKLLAIEVHDEFEIRANINSVLRKYGFVFFHTGELTIAFNLKCVKNYQNN